MPRVLHLIDDSDPHELRLALGPLLARLSNQRWQQYVAVMSGRLSRFPFLAQHRVQRIPLRSGLHFLSGPSIKRCISRHQIDLLHAWGLDTAYTAVLASEGALPVTVSIWNPHFSEEDARKSLVLNLHDNIGVLCQADMVKQRLVERGVIIERCTTVRPGVDFSVINELKRNRQLKQAMQIDSNRTIVLLPSPPTERGGHRLGMWATEIAHHLLPDLLLLMPGVSPEQQKLARYIETSPYLSPASVIEDRYLFESLLAVSDLLLVPALGDISTTSIAWAMAASVPILGCAIPCITEFIAEGHNGYLVKPNEPTAMAGKLIKAIQDRNQNGALRDMARAQAFEAFGMTRYIDQTQLAYDNLLRGLMVSKDMVDSAIDI